MRAPNNVCCFQTGEETSRKIYCDEVFAYDETDFDRHFRMPGPLFDWVKAVLMGGVLLSSREDAANNP